MLRNEKAARNVKVPTPTSGRQKVAVGVKSSRQRPAEDIVLAFQDHLEECAEVRKETNAALLALAQKLEPWNRTAIFLDKLTTFLTKYGLRLVWTILTALIAGYAGVLVQGWNAQQSAEKAEKTAQTAAVAAQTAAATSASANKSIGRKLDAVVTATGAQPTNGGP